ncbi:tRNA ligase kinase domain-containing protein, partial [Endogone sp. FLAS-F59071]
KTTLSLALKELFGFAHIQNDNITQKNTATKFYNTIIDEFKEHDVVIADKNNHLAMHREGLTSAINAKYPNTCFIALYWVHDNHSISDIFATTSGRVHARGDNHQSLHPTEDDVDPIIQKFLNEFVAYDPLSNPGDEAIHEIIELDPLDDEFTMLRKTISQLCPLIGVPSPSESEMRKALDNTKKYRPTVRKVFKSKSKGKPRYFGVHLDGDVCTLLTQYLAKYEATVDEVTQKRFQQLIAGKRVPNQHHITLVHSFDIVHLEGEERRVGQAVWDKYSDEMEGGKEGRRVTVRFRSLVSTKRLMTLEVEEIVPAEASTPNKILHVTVGTMLDEIKAMESNVVLERLLRDGGQVPPEHGEVKRVVFEEQLEIGGMVKSFY